MTGLCKDCEYFKIIQEPIKNHSKWFDAGIAYCKKYNQYIPFLVHEKFDDLHCVEEEEGTE